MRKRFYLLILMVWCSASGCSQKSTPTPVPPAFVPPPPKIYFGVGGGGLSQLANTRVVRLTYGNRPAPLELDSLILYGELGGQKVLVEYYFPTLQQVDGGTTPLGKIIFSRPGGVVVQSTGSLLGGSASNKMSDNPTPNTASGVFEATLTDGIRVYGNFSEAWTKR